MADSTIWRNLTTPRIASPVLVKWLSENDCIALQINGRLNIKLISFTSFLFYFNQFFFFLAKWSKSEAIQIEIRDVTVTGRR